jgi:hypothetical protein
MAENSLQQQMPSWRFCKHFSMIPRRKKTSATEWLQKFMNNKVGVGWTDLPNSEPF